MYPKVSQVAWNRSWSNPNCGRMWQAQLLTQIHIDYCDQFKNNPAYQIVEIVSEEYPNTYGIAIDGDVRRMRGDEW